MRDVVDGNEKNGQTTIVWPYKGDEAAMLVRMKPALEVAMEKDAEGRPDPSEWFRGAEDDLADSYARTFLMKRQEMGLPDAEARRCRTLLTTWDGSYTVTATPKRSSL
jgi:hypothetical protein